MVYPDMHQQLSDQEVEGVMSGDSESDSYNGMKRVRDAGMNESMEENSLRRKRRSFVPTYQKDATYWGKRVKNNLAAKRSRDKRRLADMQLEKKLSKLVKENKDLRSELDNIRLMVQEKLENRLYENQIPKVISPQNPQHERINHSYFLSTRDENRHCILSPPRHVASTIPICACVPFIPSGADVPPNPTEVSLVSGGGVPRESQLRIFPQVWPPTTIPNPSFISYYGYPQHSGVQIPQLLSEKDALVPRHLAHFAGVEQHIASPPSEDMNNTCKLSSRSHVTSPPHLQQKGDLHSLVSVAGLDQSTGDVDSSSDDANRKSPTGHLLLLNTTNQPSACSRVSTKELGSTINTSFHSPSTSPSDPRERVSPVGMSKLPHKLRAKMLLSYSIPQESHDFQRKDCGRTSNGDKTHTSPCIDQSIIMDIKQEKEDIVCPSSPGNHTVTGNVFEVVRPSLIPTKLEHPICPFPSVEDEIEEARKIVHKPQCTTSAEESAAYIDLVKAASALVQARIQGKDLFMSTAHRLMRKRTREMNAEEKYRDKRSRNNMAAKKCRDAKKLLTNYRAARSRYYEVENTSLKNEMEVLKRDVVHLRKLVRQKGLA